MEGCLALRSVSNHIASDSFPGMIHRQHPPAILTCLNLWLVGQQLFDAIVPIAGAPIPPAEQCLDLIDVIWVPEGVERRCGVG